jgi:hypothetical protein
MLFGLFKRLAAVVLGVWCVATAVVAHSNWVDLNMKIPFLEEPRDGGRLCLFGRIWRGRLQPGRRTVSSPRCDATQTDTAASPI